MHEVKDAFGQIALQRRAARSQRVSLLERLYASSISSASSRASGEDDTPNAAAEREEDLRKLLKTALTSLETLHKMYETRERRWREEEMRMREEREGMDVLLQQAFGAYLKAQPDP